jgi:hypothetical protein
MHELITFFGLDVKVISTVQSELSLPSIILFIQEITSLHI